MFVKVAKLKNKLTGEISYKVQHLKKINYEFECEALADFKYTADQSASGLSNRQSESIIADRFR